MLNPSGSIYNGEHSVSFGDLGTVSKGGVTYNTFIPFANSWTDWHAIPSSRPSITHPAPAIKFIEIPGSSSYLDLTEFLTGGITYGQRQGSLSFYIDNEHENWETIRRKIVNTLHGKSVKMVLEDDPMYYYDGRFTVGNWESGASNSSITISYQLSPYKYDVMGMGSEPVIWDTFNFETDYDYSVIFYPNITVNNETKTYHIKFPNPGSFTAAINAIQGSSDSVQVTFNGSKKTLNDSMKAYTWNYEQSNDITLKLVGTGVITVVWRGVAL